jgi:hypothetical protein
VAVDRVSTLGGLDLRLASWLPAKDQYQNRLLPVDPESETISGDRPGLTSIPFFRVFAQRSWRGGESATAWWERERSRYRQSSNVRPASIGDGLVLGARQQVTQLSGATFNDGRRFGYGEGLMWVAEDSDAYSWDTVNEDWNAAAATGGSTTDVTSLTDGDDGNMYSGHNNNQIRQWTGGGGSATHYAPGAADPFVHDPVVRSFAGVLYALDGDSLYEIDKSVADTRTLRGDIQGNSAVYLAETPWCYARMSLSDRGPIWLQRLDNGQTLLHLYDPNADVQEVLGKISVDFVFPYSLFFTHGFAFAAIRYAPTHASAGDAYLWFKRGAQDGYAGPFRSTTGSTASKPVLIAGVIGDDLIVYFDGAVWAYNLTDGGIYMLAAQTTTGTPQDAVTMGKDVFITPVTSGGSNNAVERFDTKAYTTQTATIDLGKHDWDYPGQGKILLDVTVVTDPLPANTSVQVAVSVDGDTPVTLSGTHNVDGETRFTWTASTAAGTTYVGIEFELRLILSSSSTTATPTIREVSARATGADHVLETVMQVDCGNVLNQRSHTFIAALKALATSPTVVSFTDRFQLAPKDTATAYDVTVEDVITPPSENWNQDENISAQVKVRAVSLQ